jgi:hypothetical protein
MIQNSAGEDKEKSQDIANKIISILVLDCYNSIKEERAITVNIIYKTNFYVKFFNIKSIEINNN